MERQFQTFQSYYLRQGFVYVRAKQTMAKTNGARIYQNDMFTVILN